MMSKPMGVSHEVVVPTLLQTLSSLILRFRLRDFVCYSVHFVPCFLLKIFTLYHAYMAKRASNLEGLGTLDELLLSSFSEITSQFGEDFLFVHGEKL